MTHLSHVILREGINCWCIERATRAAYLIDAAAYFARVREVIMRAERSLILIGWDVDSRTRLLPRSAEPRDAWPTTLLDLLNAVLEARPQLHAYVLGWDFSVLYTFEREKLPTYRFGWDGHERLSYRMDGTHPVGASHHQKLLVADDEVAFVGGLDLTIRRWDTPEHLAHDPDRVDPAGIPYPPMHDVQMIVEGPVAGRLGELARSRWLAATGQVIAPPDGSGAGRLWPPTLLPDLANAPLAISRTLSAPEPKGAGVREISKLTLDSIAAARRWIYLENQFFTSTAVGAAVAASLATPSGPEIVVVLPREESGWLEKISFGVLRGRLLAELRAADRYGRFRCYYPHLPGLGNGCLNVHSKVTVIDDGLVRVGSANLTNRSMGLDTECDLAFEADEAPEAQASVARLRNRLLAEHLGTSPDQVAEQIARHGSLIGGIESLRTPERSLAPLPLPELEGPELHLAIFDGAVCDPEQPAPDALLEKAIQSETRRPLRRSLLRSAVALSIVFALIALWQLTPLRDLLVPEHLAELGRRVRGPVASPLLVLGCYLVGAVVLFPISVLLIATALLFDPAESLLYGLGGALSSAALAYWVGRWMSAWQPRWLRGPRMQRLQSQLAAHGLVAVVTARLLPVGNFTLINLAAGAIPIRFRDFMLGNLLGLLPGVVGLSFFVDRLEQAVRKPGLANLSLLGLVVLAFVVGIWGLRRKLRHAREGSAAGEG